MRFRKLALAVGLAGALGCEVASALGLGEIKLNSTLNQPLDAEIKLLRLRDLSENEILVNLASSEDFKLAGVDRVFFLNDLRFQIVLNGASGPVIKVSSRKPIREPYLNFLLETQWPNGRILREYTLLMDLPVYGDETVRPVQSTQASSQTQSAPAPRTQPIAQPQAPAPKPVAQAPEVEQPLETRRSQPSRATSTPDTYGPVGADDTLWEIALKARPNREFSVQQTMLAIQRLNPEAFINGNINLLRKGQVLRLPKANDIAELNTRQAVTEVAFQNDQWSSNTGSDVTGAQIDGSRRSGHANDTASESRGRLKLASSADAENVEAGRGAGEIGGDTEALQNELAITMEELDKTSRENVELKDRLRELEEQIQTMERLVDVSSQELRALQLAAQQDDSTESADDATAELMAGSDESEVAVNESESAMAEIASETASSEAPVAETSVIETDVVEANVAETATAIEATAQPEPAKVMPSNKVVVASKPEKSFLDLIFDNILYVGAGLLAVLAGLLFFLRRKDDEDDEFEIEEDVFQPEDSLDAELDAGDELVLPEETPEDIEAELAELDLDDVGDELGLEEESSADSVGESQTGDAVSEADIYIAYGKFDQAEDMLVKALDNDSSDMAARLKLLEVYAETQDAAKFDSHYGEVLASGDGDAQERAADLRNQLTDVGEFDPAAVAAPSLDEAVQEDELEADLGDGLDFDLGDETFTSESDELSLDDGGLELDLGDGESLELDSDVDSDIDGAADSDEFSLDLDLGEDSELTLEDDLEVSDLESDGLDLDLSGLDEPATDSSLDDLDSGLDALDTGLELDLDGIDGETEEDLSSFDLSGDLSNDETPSVELEEPVLDFDLDDDGDTEELSLDLSDMDASELAEEASDEPVLEETREEEALELDTESLAAEDLAADALNDAVDFDLGAASESPLEEAQADGGDDEDDDHFDLALDDVDLESLDKEVEALSANLDMVEEAFGEDTPAAELSLEDEVSLDSLDALSVQSEVSDFDVALDLETESAETELSLDTDLSAFASADDDSFDLELDVESDLDLSVDDTVVDEVPLVEEAAAEESLDNLTASEEPEFDLAADLGLSDADMAEPTSEEDVFNQALGDLPDPEDALELDAADEEMDFLADTDEAATKLDLARAYIDMGDQDGAKDILDEVLQEGSDVQKGEAEELLSRMN